jgi:hypothetical protein
LACTSPPSLMPMICKFGLLMYLQNSCIFISQLVSLLSKNSVFSLTSILSLSPKFCLPVVPVCWSGFQLYFSLGLRKFLPRISV